MTANDSESYLGYLNKLVEKCNNTCHCSIDKKTFYGDYSALQQILNHLNLKLVIESGILSIRIFLAKATSKIGQEKYLLLILC